MLYIFEMANNHQGDVDHAFLIVDQFGALAKLKGITAGIKLQFRQLDTFIHPSYQDSDLKYVKRFRDTRLSKFQFAKIVKRIKKSGLLSIATPFDNESLAWIEDLDIDVVKIASCSVDDWPLLRETVKLNKKFIISTAAADIDTLRRVYNLFKAHRRDFAFMHCVGEYPTPPEHADLDRICRLRKAFPDVEIGLSTHESPDQKSLAPFAVALGSTILEKHVGCLTDKHSLNAYSCTVDDMEKVIDEVEFVAQALIGKSTGQKETLGGLKRGVYCKRNIAAGRTLTHSDVFFALPVLPGQADASKIDQIVGTVAKREIEPNESLMVGDLSTDSHNKILDKLRRYIGTIAKKANVTITAADSAEISAHFGIENFYKTGATIIDKVNREFCKKLIIMLPGQAHPEHHHIRKEEAFELLWGDCTLTLNGSKVDLRLGVPIVIARATKHAFSSVEGCVIEEVSTTHYPGDSVYTNPNINKLLLRDRKISINLWDD